MKKSKNIAKLKSSFNTIDINIIKGGLSSTGTTKTEPSGYKTTDTFTDNGKFLIKR